MAATSAYDANALKETRNHQSVAAKDEAFRKLKEFLQVFILLLMANEKISNEQLVAMGLHSREHAHKDPLPKPTKTPMLEAFSGKHHEMDVYVTAEQLGNTTTYTRENALYSVVLRYKMEGEEEWKEIHSSRLHVHLTFDESHVKKQVKMMAAWVNPRFEYGPWSEEVTVIIN
jgi:hypothetical protein